MSEKRDALEAKRFNGFRDFERWKQSAKKHGCSVRKVSKNKTTGEYWQARRNGMIFGFFLTGIKHGSLAKTWVFKEDDDEQDRLRQEHDS